MPCLSTRPRTAKTASLGPPPPVRASDLIYGEASAATLSRVPTDARDNHITLVSGENRRRMVARKRRDGA